MAPGFRCLIHDGFSYRLTDLPTHLLPLLAFATFAPQMLHISPSCRLALLPFTPDLRLPTFIVRRRCCPPLQMEHDGVACGPGYARCTGLLDFEVDERIA